MRSDSRTVGLVLLAGMLLLATLCVAPRVASAGAAPGLVTTALPLQLCPGFPLRLNAPTANVLVQLPSDELDAGASLQAWGSKSAFLLGPSNFTCTGSSGSADGGLVLTLLGPDDPCSAHTGAAAACPGDYYSGPIVPTERIQAIFNPGGAIPNFELACAYFPAAQEVSAAALAAGVTLPGCLQTLPPGQSVQQLDDNSVAFYQPADDAHPSPTFGVVVGGFSEPNVLTGGTEETCTLPADGAYLCKPVLSAFLTGYGQQYDPASGSAAAALDALPWFAPPVSGSGPPDAPTL